LGTGREGIHGIPKGTASPHVETVFWEEKVGHKPTGGRGEIYAEQRGNLEPKRPGHPRKGRPARTTEKRGTVALSRG